MYQKQSDCLALINFVYSKFEQIRYLTVCIELNLFFFSKITCS